MAAFAEKLKEKLADVRDARDLPAALEPKIRDWSGPGDVPRLVTARACAALCEQLGRADGAAIVRSLASFTPKTSIAAMERNFTTAVASKRLLQEDARWIVLRQVKGLLGERERGERAKLLLADLADLLTADEINKMLADGLAELTRRADELLRIPPPPPQPVPDEEIVIDESYELANPKKAADALRKLAGRLEAEGKETSRISIRITAWKRRQT